MSQPIPHIDAIAREKNRDVLFLHFEDPDSPINEIVLAWLEDHEIAYADCLGLEEESLNDHELQHTYIDLAVDEEDALYRELCEYLEDDEGNMKLEGVLFFVLSLETALELVADRAVAMTTRLQ
ncbi:hypothetical protein [Acinetobacter sp. B51(2017)]|uniref:hypothetical protein n=1 Tax=Acinetobacter sp. B51(2017) TaxID=2060938 RepID=UPI000F08613D|nr:hypothetical protein [Acinetobacter sp. B51(2017)]